MGVRESRIQPLTLGAYSDLPLYNTKAVVHQTGVLAPTLRAWERRYGILAPHRGENDYRLYSERDMIIITWLRDRVESGMTISQAIALLRSLEAGRRHDRIGRVSPGAGADHADRADTRAHDAQEQSADSTAANGASVDTPFTPGEQLRRFSLDDLSAALVRQFVNLDEAAASHTIAQALAIYPIEDVCLSLLTPALAEIGRRWAEGTVTVTVEHFGAAMARAQLESLFRSAATNEAGPLALVANAPGEQHEIGSLMLALFLRRAGARVVYLGQSIEPESLVAAVNSFQPRCVALSATMAPQAITLMDTIRQLRQSCGACPALYFGGQAFAGSPELRELIEQSPGVYLNMNACEAAREIKRRLTPVV